jgi:hypothetical protein
MKSKLTVFVALGFAVGSSFAVAESQISPGDAVKQSTDTLDAVKKAGVPPGKDCSTASVFPACDWLKWKIGAPTGCSIGMRSMSDDEYRQMVFLVHQGLRVMDDDAEKLASDMSCLLGHAFSKNDIQKAVRDMASLLCSKAEQHVFEVRCLRAADSSAEWDANPPSTCTKCDFSNTSFNGTLSIAANLSTMDKGQKIFAVDGILHELTHSLTTYLMRANKDLSTSPTGITCRESMPGYVLGSCDPATKSRMSEGEVLRWQYSPDVYEPSGNCVGMKAADGYRTIIDSKCKASGRYRNEMIARVAARRLGAFKCESTYKAFFDSAGAFLKP